MGELEGLRQLLDRLEEGLESAVKAMYLLQQDAGRLRSAERRAEEVDRRAKGLEAEAEEAKRRLVRQRESVLRAIQQWASPENILSLLKTDLEHNVQEAVDAIEGDEGRE
jgi:hypothetical protein